MRYIIPLLLIAFLLTPNAISQAPAGSCHISQFKVVADGPNSCMLEYTFLNDSNEKIDELRIETEYGGGVTQTDDPAGGFLSAGSTTNTSWSTPTTSYKWSATGTGLGLHPGQRATVRLHIATASRQKFLQDAITSLFSFDENYLVYTTIAGSSFVYAPSHPYVASRLPMLDDSGNQILGPKSDPLIQQMTSCKPGLLCEVQFQGGRIEDKPYVLLMSASSTPGINVGNFHIPANYDALAQFCLSPNNGLTYGFHGVVQGLMPAASAGILLPNDPALVGLQVALAGVAFKQDLSGIYAVTPKALQLTVIAP